MTFRLGTFIEKIKNLKKENIYLVLALTLGLAMAVLNPPFDGVPDEHAHFWKAWSVAEGNLVCRPDNQIPQSAIDLPNQTVKVSVPEKGKRIVFQGFINQLSKKDSGEMATGGSAVCGATPLGYMPQALGLKVGQILGLSALGDFYLARIFNLIASVVLVYWAIRIIPFGKIILLLIGLLPMTIQQFASLGYDPLHIASTFLFIAYIVKLAYEKDRKITTTQIWALLAIALLGFNVKIGYVALSLLVFALPVSKFKNKKQYWIFMIGFVLINLIIFAGVYKYFQGTVEADAADSKINAAKQLAYVISHPINFLHIFFNQIYNSFDFFLETTLFKSGWLKKSMPQLWYVAMIFGMVLFVKNSEEVVNLTRRQRFIFLTVFLANFTISFLGLYLVWNNVGSDKIRGMQGRYFLGIFPLLLLFFYKADFSLKFDFIKKHTQMLLIIFYLVMFFFVFQHIYEIYYDKSPKEVKDISQEAK